MPQDGVQWQKLLLTRSSHSSECDCYRLVGCYIMKTDTIVLEEELSLYSSTLMTEEQQIPSKHWEWSTRLHGITLQKKEFLKMNGICTANGF